MMALLFTYVHFSSQPGARVTLFVIGSTLFNRLFKAHMFNRLFLRRVLGRIQGVVGCVEVCVRVYVVCV